MIYFSPTQWLWVIIYVPSFNKNSIYGVSFICRRWGVELRQKGLLIWPRLVKCIVEFYSYHKSSVYRLFLHSCFHHHQIVIIVSLHLSTAFSRILRSSSMVNSPTGMSSDSSAGRLLLLDLSLPRRTCVSITNKMVYIFRNFNLYSAFQQRRIEMTLSLDCCFRLRNSKR